MRNMHQNVEHHKVCIPKQQFVCARASGLLGLVCGLMFLEYLLALDDLTQGDADFVAVLGKSLHLDVGGQLQQTSAVGGSTHTTSPRG